MTNAVTILQKLKVTDFKAFKRILRLDVFKHVAGVLMTFNGLACLLGGLGNDQLLEMSDAIFGFPIRYSMLAFGSAWLIVAVLCLFGDRTRLGLWLAAWLALNFIIYRLGLWSDGWHHSCGFLFEQLGFSMQISDALLSLSSVFLLVGSGITLWHQRRIDQAAGFIRTSCPSCGVSIKFADQRIGQKILCPHCQAAITLRGAENLKMSCFFCKGHIEFPAHALGQKISCPHCNKDITLKEPA